MQRFLRKQAVCLMLGFVSAGALAVGRSSAADGHSSVDMLSLRGSHGHVAFKADYGRFPGGARVSFSRTHSEKARGRIADALAKSSRGRHGAKDASRAPSPRVLAMYDVSISADGRKWQPGAGEPVRVEVELDEPVSVDAASSLGVVHLADDGTVEELPPSRYGFTYNAGNTAVAAFWFSAFGFSVYSIVDMSGELVTPRRFYHFYDHPTTENGHSFTLPYVYHDESNDVVNVQIVKDGDILKEPPIPLDVLDEHGVIKSMFEGWYVVSNHVRSATAVESKLDPTNEYFQFVWPVGATDKRMTFTNAVSVTETEDWDYYVVPLYEHARFLQFNENSHDETDHGAAARIIKRKLVAINDETGEAVLKVSDVEAALKNSLDEYFCGWEYLDTDGQYKQLLVYSGAGKPQEQFITVDDALFAVNGGSVVPLYPYYVSAHFLHFDSNADGAHAKYVGSIFVRSSSDFSTVETSGERKGYNFAGWCAGFKDEDTKEVTFGEVVTDANGNFIPNKTITNPLTGAVAFTTDASGNIRMNEDVTLYGTWTANSDSTYRVIIWQQRATDSKNASDAAKKYYYVTHYTSPVVPATTQIAESLITSFTGTAASGDNPNNSNLTTISGKENLTDEDFTGFHYGRWECKDETVAPDASTVINVYYDRDLITIQFCVYQNQAQTVYTVTSSTTGDIYGTDDGENYFAVYYNNGQWYKTRTSVPGYTYSSQYTSTRYDKDGNALNTNDNTTSPQYRRANSQSSGYAFRISRGMGAYYYFFEIFYNDGKWYQTRTETTTYAYSDPYVGTRYTRGSTNWVADDAHTFTGLYGQTFAFNGYEWPYSDYWYDGHGTNAGSGTRTTFLDSFKENLVFYRANATTSDNKPIYFYKQTVTGTYEDGEDGQPNNYANTVKVGGNSDFRITDKYSGFKAVQYKSDSGNWKNTTVSSTASAITEYDSASFNSQLKIRFERNKHELIYQFTDDNGDHILRDTGKVVFYEAPLAEYDIAYTNLNWTGCDITNRTFAGWYEDASLTVPFDFDGTMPDAKKVVYAKWSPLQHKVIIDPNGGELHGSDSTWFYVDPDKNETIKAYHPTRDYRLDMHNGTYYYHHDLWNPLGDKHVTDTNSPSFIHNISRKAFYTTDIAQATSNEVSNPENRYTYDSGAYAFMGWYEVMEDGSLAVDPFSFGEPPTKDVTLRAIWRRMGVYTLQYESIDPDGWKETEIIHDPQRHASGNIEDGYVADAETTLAKAPTNYNKDEWVWEGWQVIDTYNNNIPLTNVRSPGDIYVVKTAHADPDNVIHFRAVYKYIGDGSSRHIPNVTDFVLDSNENAGLASDAVLPAHEGHTGTYTDGTVGSVNGLNQGVWFAGQQNNFSVNLADYSDMFAHDRGYFLLGWDPMRHVSNLIPTYTAEQTVGVDTKTDAENTLYAVWEPQIYVEFVNDTGAELRDVTLYIPSWIDGEVFRANTAKGKYAREPFSAFANGSATFNLAAGETLRLVLPDGAERDFAVMGTCSYAEGNKLVVTRIEPMVEGQEAIPDEVHSVYPGENYMVSGTMKVCPTPVQVKFTKTTYPATTDVPVRYFLHHPDGSVEEITADSGKWVSFNSVKKTLTGIGSSTNDIAKLLQKSATESVHEYLIPSIQEQYGYTTIGIGAATGDFDEWRSITKGEPSGGSYIRFYREKLEWSRYSLFWNDYVDAAVYVVFFKRIPVHVTIGKTVEGSEEDKSPDRKFNFSVTYTEHSVKVSYTKTITKTKTRQLTSSGNLQPDLPSGNRIANDNENYNPDDHTSLTDWREWEVGNWNTVVENTEAPTNVKFSSDQTPELFPARASATETFSLPDGGRHPLEIYYSSNGEGESTGTQTRSTQYTHTFTSPTRSGNRYYTTQTVTWQETIPMEITYQYETAVVTETALDDKYTLTRIGDNPANDSDHCSGVVDLPSRIYTISSINSNSINPVPGAATTLYDFTPLDTAIFTNTRKTGSLTVSKTVVNGEAGDKFPFIVTLGETVVNKDSYTPPAGVNIGPYGKVFTFSLANGDSVTLPGLPAGASYTVEEVAHDKYVATIPANATGTIAADTTISVGVTNTRKTDLHVAMKDRTTIFTGEEQHGYEISSVTGTGSAIDADGYTVTGLKSGHVLTVQHYVAPHGIFVGSYTGHVENVRFTVLNAGDDTDVTGEYLFQATPGALTIQPTPIVVTITGNTTNAVYNGEEQSVQGYAYVITHAMTHEVLTNASVYVSIPPDYQMAWGKDVGTYNMHIAPQNVIVTVPEGMSVSEVVVAANGWLAVAPAAVTIKADDKVKILNRADPPLTATVTGPAEGGRLFGDDSVAYTLSREAGEAPGTYAITASGEATQGNYAVAYVPGTFTIEELELIQRMNGSGVSVSVPVKDEMIDALGFDSQADLSAAEVATAMNTYDPNGLRRWENLVTGTATNQLLLGTTVDANETQAFFSLAYEPVLPEDLGYTVVRELHKSTGGAWSRVAGPAVGTGNPKFAVALVDGSGKSTGATGYYRILTMLVPDSVQSVTNVIPSTNIVGVLEIDSVAAHTMTAVPFGELPTDPAQNKSVKVASFVGSSFVADGDLIRLRENDTFKVWEKSEGQFQAFTAVNAKGVATEVDDGEESSLALGKSVWVSRATHDKPFFIIGQFSGEAITNTIAGSTTDASGNLVVGCTMVTNPNLVELALNDIDWGENPNPGVAGDQIEIPLEATGTTSARLWWDATKKQWGRNVPKKVGKRYVQTFETDFTIKPGMGFWYYRVSEGAFSITVRERQDLD